MITGVNGKFIVFYGSELAKGRGGLSKFVSGVGFLLLVSYNSTYTLASILIQIFHEFSHDPFHS